LPADRLALRIVERNTDNERTVKISFSFGLSPQRSDSWKTANSVAGWEGHLISTYETGMPSQLNIKESSRQYCRKHLSYQSSDFITIGLANFASGQTKSHFEDVHIHATISATRQ